MLDPRDLRRAPPPFDGVDIEPVSAFSPSFWRYLYTEVGRAYHWIDRLPWTDDDIVRYLADPAIELWVMRCDGAPAGYFELRTVGDGSVEVAYLACCRTLSVAAWASTCSPSRRIGRGRSAPNACG